VPADYAAPGARERTMGDATATDGTARRRQGMTRQVVSNRRRRRTVVPITLDELMPEPREVVRACC